MAILHQAQLNPSKAELLRAYLPTVAGLDVAEGSELTPLGAYRFDDPAGEVGIESHLLATVDGRTIHMPVTYRAEALEGAEEWFVGTLEHSALGTRWVYNGCGDPIYAAELTRTILTGGAEVKLEVLTDDGIVERENTVHVKGNGVAGSSVPELTYGGAARSGSDTAITIGNMTVVVHHVLSSSESLSSESLSNESLSNESASTKSASTGHLAGTWPGMTEPVTMATVYSN